MCTNPNSRLLTRLLVDFLILIGLGCIAMLVLPQILQTTQRGFYCADDTLQYPYTASLVGKVHMTILVIAVPAAVVLIVEMLRAAFNGTENSSTSKSVGHATPQFVFVGVRIPTFISECYNIIGIYLFGLLLEQIVVNFTKHIVGRLRPYFFDVCQPLLLNGSSACPTTADWLMEPSYEVSSEVEFMTDYICSELAATPELLATVGHSFPSGYAATAAYAMCFLMYYLQARLTAAWLKLWRAVLQFGCLSLVCLVALERLHTHRVHFSDVFAGVVLGFVIATFVTIAVAQLFRRVLPIKQRRRWRGDPYRYHGYYAYGSNGYRKAPRYY